MNNTFVNLDFKWKDMEWCDGFNILMKCNSCNRHLIFGNFEYFNKHDDFFILDELLLILGNSSSHLKDVKCDKCNKRIGDKNIITTYGFQNCEYVIIIGNDKFKCYGYLKEKVEKVEAKMKFLFGKSKYNHLLNINQDVTSSKGYYLNVNDELFNHLSCSIYIKYTTPPPPLINKLYKNTC